MKGKCVATKMPTIGVAGNRQCLGIYTHIITHNVDLTSLHNCGEGNGY